MRSQRTRVKQSIALAGLTLALVVSGAAPLLGGDGVEAARKGKRHVGAESGHAQLVQSLSNPTPLTINEGSNINPAASTPYGTAIEVSGFGTTIVDVDVTINGFSHERPQDVSAILVGPQGQIATVFNGEDISRVAAPGVTITLDDQARNEVPRPLVSGTFQPNGSGATFPAPAPSAQQRGPALSVFNGTDPNGTWRLFVADFQSLTPNSTGRIAGGWSLRIKTANGVPTARPDSFATRAGQTLTVAGPGVLGNDSDPDGDALTAIVTAQPRQGTLTLQPDGSFTYRSTKKAKGTDSFTYIAQDADGLKSVAKADIQITKAKKKKRVRR